VTALAVFDPEARDAAPILRAAGVSVRLGGVSVIADADLELYAGDLVLLTGPNGAGKSTFLRALVGLVPASGEVEVAGRPPASLTGRAAFAYAPDEPALYEDLTLAEHAYLNAALYRDPEAEARTLDLLRTFGLGGRADEYPGTHSRGMRQKLALSLALGLWRPLTLLDEPFNALDLESQELLADLLRDTTRRGGAVLLTGHQRELAGLLGARVVAVRDGRLEPQPAEGERAAPGRAAGGP